MKFWHFKTKNFTSAALLVAISTFISAALGLLRDRLLTGVFGAGQNLDIYFTAFRIPDLIQAILIAGGINATFLPVFSEEFKKDKEKAFAFANNLLNCSLLILCILCIILAIFTPQLLGIIASGFSVEQTEKAIILTRIMFLSPLFFALSSIFSGILQYFDYFLSYALTPVFYNLGIVIGALVFVPLFRNWGGGVYGLGLGVIFGAFLHFIIQLPSAWVAGFRYRPILTFKNHRLKKVLKLMSVSAPGALFLQLNLLLITALSSRLMPGSISIFNLVNNLQGLPVGLIGLSFAMAIFPALTKSRAAQDKEGFKHNFISGFNQIIFLSLPLGIFMFFLRNQIIRIVFGSGLWGTESGYLAAACLGIFSFSTFSSSLVLFLRKSFHSMQETKIPTISEFLVFLINIVFALSLLFLLGQDSFFKGIFSSFFGIANLSDIRILAFPLTLSLTFTFQALFLFLLFLKKADFKKRKDFSSSFYKIIPLNFLTGLIIWLCSFLIGIILEQGSLLTAFVQVGVCLIFGSAFYILMAWYLKIKAMDDLMFLGLRFWKKDIKPASYLYFKKLKHRLVSIKTMLKK